LNKIIEKEKLSERVVKMVLEAPIIAQKRKAGQFIVLKIHEKGERIPLTIVDSDAQKGTITIIFQIVGKTTAQLDGLKIGDTLQDIVDRWAIRQKLKITAVWSALAAAWESVWFIRWQSL